MPTHTDRIGKWHVSLVVSFIITSMILIVGRSLAQPPNPDALAQLSPNLPVYSNGSRVALGPPPTGFPRLVQVIRFDEPVFLRGVTIRSLPSLNTPSPFEVDPTLTLSLIISRVNDPAAPGRGGLFLARVPLSGSGDPNDALLRGGSAQGASWHLRCEPNTSYAFTIEYSVASEEVRGLAGLELALTDAVEGEPLHGFFFTTAALEGMDDSDQPTDDMVDSHELAKSHLDLQLDVENVPQNNRGMPS